LNLEDTASINHPANLSLEATALNECFSQQVLTNAQYTPEDAQAGSPFAAADADGMIIRLAGPSLRLPLFLCRDFRDIDSQMYTLAPALHSFLLFRRVPSPSLPSDVAPVLYRYRRFTLAGGLALVVRAELNAFGVKKGGQEQSKQLLCVRAVNEFDSKAAGMAWRLVCFALPLLQCGISFRFCPCALLVSLISAQVDAQNIRVACSTVSSRSDCVFHLAASRLCRFPPEARFPGLCGAVG
jgi:hypothetical protein